jgi:ABC-type sugar transport system permease subunit
MAVVMPMSIAAVVWTMMYHPSNGIINSLLSTFGIPHQNFLVDKDQAMFSIVVMTLWKDAGFYMIIYLAGLQGIPEELYDAAKVDGATGWDEFRYVTLPMLRNTTTLVLILSTVFAFNVFIPIYVMTAGGPVGATEVVVYYMYKLAFRFYRLGYATTIAVITLTIALLISVLQLRITRANS